MLTNRTVWDSAVTPSTYESAITNVKTVLDIAVNEVVKEWLKFVQGSVKRVRGREKRC